ncbi:MAG TPA: hypothetical protein VLA29_08685 [Acidimicrobiia bacterium]|nr:hypothetical protein [Acidimicrobiia bacterium]
MTSSIDDLLEEITRISNQIDDLPPGSRAFEQLIAERAKLRLRARDMADALRHPESVRTEIEMLEGRRSEIAGMAITKGFSEKRLGRTIQDPGAYSHDINRRIEAEHAAEVDEINERLEHLRSLLEGIDR